VFDTNVVVLALIFGRCLRWLRRAWVTGTVIPIVCRETAAELVRVLTYPKFLLDSDERETLLGDYLPFAEVAHLPDELPDLPLACRDRDDDLVVLAAAIGSCRLRRYNGAWTKCATGSDLAPIVMTNNARDN
jgi:predicted nucleic acid-binding protein